MEKFHLSYKQVMEEEWDAVMGMLEIMSLESQEEYHKQKLADLKAKNTSL